MLKKKTEQGSITINQPNSRSLEMPGHRIESIFTSGLATGQDEFVGASLSFVKIGSIKVRVGRYSAYTNTKVFSIRFNFFVFWFLKE